MNILSPYLIFLFHVSPICRLDWNRNEKQNGFRQKKCDALNQTHSARD